MSRTSLRTSGGKSGASVRRNSLVSFSVPATLGKKPVWVVTMAPAATAATTSATAAKVTAVARRRPCRTPGVCRLATIRSPRRSRAAASSVDSSAAGKTGFADANSSSIGCEPSAVDAPPVSEPPEQRTGDEAADDDATLAPDEGGGRVRGEMGVLDRAERHQSVRHEGGCRACEAEKRRPLRLSLCPTGEKRENEPWRGEQADIGRPRMAGQASKVLVSAAEHDGERQRDRDRDDVHEQRLAGATAPSSERFSAQLKVGLPSPSQRSVRGPPRFPPAAASGAAPAKPWRAERC